MKAIFRVLSLLIIISMLASLFGCSGIKTLDSETAVEIYDNGDSSKRLALDKEYTIVCNSFYKPSNDITSSLTYIKNAFKESLSLNTTYSTEVAGGSENAISEYVILLGPTEREETKSATEGLGINDYTYKIISESVVVICGGSTAATLKAAEKFCADVLLYKDYKASDGEKGANVGASYTYKYKYPYTDMTLNGVDIKDFKIAISKNAELGMAQSLLNAFGSYTGYSIPVVTYDSLSGNEKGVICLGSYSRDGLDKYSALADGAVMRFKDGAEGITVGVDFTHQKYLSSVLEELSENSQRKQTALPSLLPYLVRT